MSKSSCSGMRVEPPLPWTWPTQKNIYVIWRLKSIIIIIIIIIIKIINIIINKFKRNIIDNLIWKVK